MQQVLKALNHIQTAKHCFSTLLPVIHCNYLLKIGRLDEQEAVFERLTLSGVPQN